jgi:hypothetical protein
MAEEPVVKDASQNIMTPQTHDFDVAFGNRVQALDEQGKKAGVLSTSVPGATTQPVGISPLLGEMKQQAREDLSNLSLSGTTKGVTDGLKGIKENLSNKPLSESSSGIAGIDIVQSEVKQPGLEEAASPVVTPPVTEPEATKDEAILSEELPVASTETVLPITPETKKNYEGTFGDIEKEGKESGIYYVKLGEDTLILSNPATIEPDWEKNHSYFPENVMIVLNKESGWWLIRMPDPYEELQSIVGERFIQDTPAEEIKEAIEKYNKSKHLSLEEGLKVYNKKAIFSMWDIKKGAPESCITFQRPEPEIIEQAKERSKKKKRPTEEQKKKTQESETTYSTKTRELIRGAA